MSVKRPASEKTHQCEFCGLLFSQRGNLISHIRIHTGEKPFTCSICNKRFADQTNKTNHERSHTGDKRYCCEFCGLYFLTSAILKKHVRKHTGERPYNCDICGKDFAQSDYLSVHKLTHKQQKHFSCHICESKFTRSCSLHRHIRTHTGVKPFQCSICTMTFSRKTNMIKHLKTHSHEKTDINHTEYLSNNHTLNSDSMGCKNESRSVDNSILNISIPVLQEKYDISQIECDNFELNSDKTLKHSGPVFQVNDRKNKVTDNVFDKVTDNVFDNVKDNAFDKVTDNVFDKVRDNIFDKLTDNVFDKVTENVFDESASLPPCEEILKLSKRKPYVNSSVVSELEIDGHSSDVNININTPLSDSLPNKKYLLTDFEFPYFSDSKSSLGILASIADQIPRITNVEMLPECSKNKETNPYDSSPNLPEDNFDKSILEFFHTNEFTFNSLQNSAEACPSQTVEIANNCITKFPSKLPSSAVEFSRDNSGLFRNKDIFSKQNSNFSEVNANSPDTFSKNASVEPKDFYSLTNCTHGKLEFSELNHHHFVQEETSLSTTCFSVQPTRSSNSNSMSRFEKYFRPQTTTAICSQNSNSSEPGNSSQNRKSSDPGDSSQNRKSSDPGDSSQNSNSSEPGDSSQNSNSSDPGNFSQNRNSSQDGTSSHNSTCTGILTFGENNGGSSHFETSKQHPDWLNNSTENSIDLGQSETPETAENNCNSGSHDINTSHFSQLNIRSTNSGNVTILDAETQNTSQLHSRLIPSTVKSTTNIDHVKKGTIKRNDYHPNKPQRSKSNIKSKQSTLHTKIKYQCKLCNKQFSQKCNLITHARIHSGEKPFQCADCNLRFSHLTNLTHHVAIHSGERQFACPLCGVKFVEKGALKNHLRIHTGERPYQCTICGKSFRRSNALSQHSLIHRSDRKYKCELCAAEFTQNSSYLRHKKSHSGERPFQCQVCESRFTRKHNLSVHLRQVHHLDHRDTG